MKKRRLLALARKLYTVPAKRFDLSSWVGCDWRGAKDLSCGTSACALGWATTIPHFRRLGLRLVPSNIADRVARVTFNDRYNFDAACELFDISRDTAELLFSPSGYLGPAGPVRVAKRIRKLVKEGAL